MNDVDPVPIEGFCAPGFESVAEAFAYNVQQRGDDGAACAVYLDGEIVVNLHGGRADRNASRWWRKDTLVNVFSAAKPVVAWAVLRLAETGVLDLDMPVAHYWPEFGQAGKERVTVRMLLCHRSGLPALQSPAGDETIYNWSTMVRLLERESLAWEPGSAQGYHVFTFGWLLGELVRRATGIPIERYLHDHLQQAHAIDLRFGVSDREMQRVADIEPYLKPAEKERRAHERRLRGAGPKAPRAQARPSWQDDLYFKAFHNPPTLGYGTNGNAWRQSVIPGGNGHATGEALARFYGLLVNGEELLSADWVSRARQEASSGEDKVLGLKGRFGLGFMLSQSRGMFDPVPGVEVFGHAGAGGAVAFGDPQRGLGFSYVTRHITAGMLGDRRSQTLIAALYPGAQGNS